MNQHSRESHQAYQFGGIDYTELQLGNASQTHRGIAKVLRLLRQRCSTGLMSGHVLVVAGSLYMQFAD